MRPLQFALGLAVACVALSGCGRGTDSAARDAAAGSLTVTWDAPEQTYDGYTLIHPIGGNQLIWVAMDGSVEKVLDLPFAITHAEQLPTGNLVVMAKNSMMEISPDGEILQLDWPNQGFVLHHELLRLPNGNFLGLVQQIRPDLGNIAVDRIIEVDEFGAIVWTWDALDHFDPEVDREDFDPPHPVIGGNDWLHINSVDVFPDGDLLLSVRNLDRIVRVDYPSGEVIWSWGDGVLGHQHAADVLDSGNILLFDNGFHRTPDDLCATTVCSSRALEIDPETNEVVWRYEPEGLFSRGFGDADRLPNGNTLITFGQLDPEAKVIEVSPDGDVLWSLTSHTAHAVPGVVPVAKATLYRAQRVDEVPG